MPSPTLSTSATRPAPRGWFNAAPVARELVVGAATRDAKHLWKLLRPKVEQMHLGYGVEAMELTAFWVEGIEHRQTGMWKGAGEDADTARRDREFADFWKANGLR